MGFWQWYLTITYFLGLSYFFVTIFVKELEERSVWRFNLMMTVFSPLTVPFGVLVQGGDFIRRIKDLIWPEEHKDGTCRSWRHNYQAEPITVMRGTNKFVNNVEITEKIRLYTQYTCSRCNKSYRRYSECDY